MTEESDIHSDSSQACVSGANQQQDNFQDDQNGQGDRESDDMPAMVSSNLDKEIRDMKDHRINTDLEIIDRLDVANTMSGNSLDY